MDLLLQALLSKQPQADQAWAAWRARIDVDALPYCSQQLFPTLIPAFPHWLEQDPAAAIFQGVVRQAWTQNQLRLHRAVELDGIFRRAGIPALIAGPVAWAMKTPRPAIRPIPWLTFLVPREQARRAYEVLMNAGWEPTCDFPPDHLLDRYHHVSAQQGNLTVKVHWRLLPVPLEDARECEVAVLSRTERLDWNQHALRTVSPEATLLHILCGEREGDLPWQADVTLVGTAAIDWALFLALARRFAPLGIPRLRELRQYGHLAIPHLPSDDPGALRNALRHAWRRYRVHSYRTKKPLSWPGFAGFLVSGAARKLRQAVARSRESRPSDR